MIITFSIYIAGGVDYHAPLLSFFAFNQVNMSDCVSIAMNPDLIVEGEETILLFLDFSEEESNVILDPNSATVVIKDSKWLINSTVRSS